MILLVKFFPLSLRERGSGASPPHPNKIPRQGIGDIVAAAFFKTAHGKAILAPATGLVHDDEHGDLGG